MTSLLLLCNSSAIIGKDMQGLKDLPNLLSNTLALQLNGYCLPDASHIFVFTRGFLLALFSQAEPSTLF